MKWTRLLLPVLGLLFSVTHALPVADAAISAQNGPDLVRRIYPDLRGPPRTVEIWVMYSPQAPIVGPEGVMDFPFHTVLWVEKTQGESGLYIEINDDGKGGWCFDAIENRKTSTVQRHTYPVGTTRYTNYAIAGDKSDGLMLQAARADPTYRSGEAHKGRFNTCHDFVSRLVTSMNLDIPPAAAEMMARYGNAIHIKNLEGPVENVNWFDARAIKSTTPVAVCNKRDVACGKPTPGQGASLDPSKFRNELITLQDTSRIPSDAFLAFPPDDDAPLPDGKSLPPEAMAGPKGAEVAFAKAGRVLQTFTMVARTAIEVAGAGAAIAGAIFVILDFVDGQWKGGIIGGVGLAAGAAIGLAVSGPVGWVIGAVVATLFAFLPGVLQPVIDPADRKEIQGIIQYKMFGDPKHTGNEKCRDGTADSPGNSKCQALYGAGALAAGLGFNNFDAIVFLTEFNDGYPMTIPDMAAKFHVIDEKVQGDGADKMATITCKNKAQVVTGKYGFSPADPDNWCNNPSFAINRQNVKLPRLDDTADKVFDRIVSDSNKNGDCKLIAYPGTFAVPSYNLSITGLPSAVACGLDHTVNVEGQEVPAGSTSPGGTDGSKSTDGQGGARVNAPSPTPFKILDPKDYACIAHGSDGPFCLPPGTYHKQHGLGFEVKGVDTLTLPKDWGFSIHYQPPPKYHSQLPGKAVDHPYNTNQSPSTNGKPTPFTGDWDMVDIDANAGATFTITAPNGSDGPDPVCCLFNDVEFRGNVWCMGVGGGDTLPQWSGQAQSVSCHAGAQIWLYADHYNDPGGVNIRGDVRDLSKEPYGTDGSFTQRVKALWVSKGS